MSPDQIYQIGLTNPNKLDWALSTLLTIRTYGEQSVQAQLLLNVEDHILRLYYKKSRLDLGRTWLRLLGVTRDLPTVMWTDTLTNESSLQVGDSCYGICRLSDLLTNQPILTISNIK